jgi:GT2 family glycosyltransferase
MTKIDVVVPVYRGARQTRRCIDSVLSCAQRERFEIVVVDDAAPEPDLAAYVGALAGERRITLLRNERNEGFVRSVNRAMALHADRDVVLLNSDTEVANDWLDRLHRCAHAGERIGTATPFSNNATICSYPFEGWSGNTPGGLGVAALDRMFATANAGRSADLPTAVGFCMYIRRDCLDAVGLFDAERFGRGYGEENDFCMRAAKAGWRNLLAADVYVFHEGGVSFSGERGALAEAATKAMDDAHPDYMAGVRAFVFNDPLAPFRAAVDEARIAQDPAQARHVVCERAAERELLAARVRDLALIAGEQEAAIASLRVALAHAESLVTERTGEIARLRTALAHAESLAYERADELARIRDNWLGKTATALARRKR